MKYPKATIDQVLQTEPINREQLEQNLADGTAIIVKNKHRDIVPLAVGKGLTTKINANIGTSQDKSDLDLEIDKLKVAVNFGAHAIMDLSTGGNLTGIRKRIIEESTVPLGTVPIYQVAVNKSREGKSFLDIEPDELFDVIEQQAEEGVDFVTVHCGVTQRIAEILDQKPRLLDVVSRGGAFLLKWIRHHGKENPLYEQYDRLLDICAKHHMCISLGDGLRPGALADATDHAQIEELYTLGELVLRARKAGVPTMVEGPGHMPLNQIVANMELQKKACHDAPFYILGPLVTDISIGYDHISGAIGGAVAAQAGADFLCYVTPAEHLRLPDLKDVKEGVIASRIAAHAADIAVGLPHAQKIDDEMARAKRDFKWDRIIELCVDPPKAREYRESVPTKDDTQCSMCGEFCAMKKDQDATDQQE